MSEWAIGNGDTEERTAYEYRELYLDQDLEFKPFHCPFCDIPLTPVNLYKDEELARSPHFRACKEQHRYGCDGAPRKNQTKETKPVKRHFEKSEFHLPEALVPRRPTVARTPRCHSKEQNIPNEKEVAQRRRDASGRLGPAIYRTSLIRSVAIAFLGVFKEAYKLQKINNWDEERRRKWVADLLRESSLTLYDGYTLTYHNAFRNIRFPPPPKPRIFHGWGLLTITENTLESTEYRIAPDSKIEHNVEERTLHYPVEISISITQEDGRPTGSQRHLLERLVKAATQNLDARWFAYGTMRLCEDNIYRLNLEHVDHLYLHKLRKPIA